MKFYLETDLERFASSLLKENLSNQEIEFRLGQTVYNGVKKNFKPGVTELQFKQTINSFKKNNIPYTERRDKVLTFNDNIRCTIFKDENGKTINLWERKIKGKSFDTDMKLITVRLATATEFKLTSNQPKVEDYILLRSRERISFKFDTFAIDLTIVKQQDIITYEAELEFTTIPKVFSDLIHPLKTFLSNIFPNYISLMGAQEYDTIRDYYLQTKGNNREPNAKNVTWSNVKDMKNYSVTNKLNGVGYNLFFCKPVRGIGGGIYLINSSIKYQNQPGFVMKKSGNEFYHKFDGTILQGELFKNIFHLFDSIKINHKNITEYIHSERIKQVNFLIDHINRIEKFIEIKRFIYTGNLAQDTLAIIQYIQDKYKENALEDNDGFMYTPVDKTFYNTIALKYKFASTMTIDFKVKNMKIVDDKKVFDIYSYASNSNQTTYDILFKGSRNFALDNPVLEVDQNNELFDSITNDLVIECLFDKSRKVFLPTRIRFDKDLPNYISIAENTFDDIMQPIELNELIKIFDKTNSTSGYESMLNKFENNLHITSPIKKTPIKANSPKNIIPPPSQDIVPLQNIDCLNSLRKFHLTKKRELILKYTKKEVVLDLGFGRGGDIHSYYEAKTKKIWAVEPNPDNYNEAEKRVKTVSKTKKLPKIEFIKDVKAEESGKIFDAMGGNEKVDVVAAFFSLTFLFETKDIIRRLTNTVSRVLNMGGKFIGTVMDGERTYNLLKNKDSIIVDDCYSIVKYYPDDESLNNYGMKIQINMNGTIVNDQFEYLAFFSLLEQELKERGVYLVETEYFDPPNNLSESEKQLSRLFRTFVFERRESPLELKQKEEKLLEKKQKLKMLDEEETKAFIIELEDIKYTLARTGTIGDGSCFFHSLLRCINDMEELGLNEEEYYSKMSTSDKKKLVNILREQFSEMITIEEWKELGMGSLFLLNIQKILKKNVEIESKGLTHLSDYVDHQANNISDYENYLIYNSPEDKKERTKKFFNTVLNHIFNKFKEKMKDCSVWVGSDIVSESVDLFEYLSNQLNLDIYIIRDVTRKPYRSADCDVKYKNRKSIIVLWVGASHYEAVGMPKNIDGSNKKTIVRVFEPDDPLIKAINKYVCG